MSRLRSRKRAEAVHLDEAAARCTCGSAATTAGLKRSVWPTASTAPRRAAAAISASASASVRVSGFSTSTVHAARRGTAARRSACASVGAAIDDGVDRPAAPTTSAKAGRAVRRRRSRRRAAGVGVDDADQRHAGHRREEPRVMLAEVADADDGDAQRRLALTTAPPRRPRPGAPADDGDAGLVGRRDDRRRPSSISVLPASSDSAVAPAARIACDRRHADDRHVEAHVLLRLGHLDDDGAGAGQAARRARSPRRCLPSPRPRRPRDASRRSSGRCRGRRSRRPCGSRTSRSAALASRRRARAVSTPARASSGCRNAVESSSSMPFSRITSATARDQRVGVLRRAACGSPTAASGRA